MMCKNVKAMTYYGRLHIFSAVVTLWCIHPHGAVSLSTGHLHHWATATSFSNTEERKKIFYLNIHSRIHLQLHGNEHVVQGHYSDRLVHTTDCSTPVVAHWLKWEIAQCVHQEILIWWLITPSATLSYIPQIVVHQLWHTGWNEK